MINIRLKSGRAIAMTLMFGLWAVGHAMAIAGLQSLDSEHWWQVVLYSGLGGGSLWLSWLCWRWWCWQAQQRPQAHYTFGGGR